MTIRRHFKITRWTVLALAIGAIAAPAAQAGQVDPGSNDRGTSPSVRPPVRVHKNSRSLAAIQAIWAAYYAKEYPGSTHQAPGGGSVRSIPTSPATPGGQQADYGVGNAYTP